MLEERIIYTNGNFIGWNDAKVHLMSHSFGRGSAIFEIFTINKTNKGPAIFRLDEHIDRLYRSADLVNMELPMDKEALQHAVLETVKKNNVSKGSVKIIGYYSQIAFDIALPQKALDISIIVLDPAQDMGGADDPFERGINLCISKWRKLDPQSVPVEAKVAANYLNGLMSRTEAKGRGFESAVLLDSQGFIAEGAIDSIFLVKNGVLMTPSRGTILASITRKSLLEIAKATGIDLYEGRLAPRLLYEADEIFLANSTFRVLPVRKIEDRELKAVPGPLSVKLKGLMDRIQSGADERFKAWLFPVG